MLRHRVRAFLAGALALGTLVAAPAVAAADCGGVETALPAKQPESGRAPLAVGDSTMLLALPSLARAGFEVNAHGCRGFSEGLALLEARRAAGTLPPVVVIALGADYSVTPSDVRAALRILGGERILVLVTPLELGGSSGSDARVVRAEGHLHPARIRVLDWVAFSHGKGAWFQPDGVHLTLPGARAFARFLAPALSVTVLRTPHPLPRIAPGQPIVLAVAGLPPGARVHVAIREPSAPHTAMLVFNAARRPLLSTVDRRGRTVVRFPWPALFAPDLCGSGTACPAPAPWGGRAPAVVHVCAPHGGPCARRLVRVS